MTWPVVMPNDDGIRPAGKQDECFYCNRKIGQPHKQNCVVVKKIVEYQVFYKGRLYKGRLVGTFTREDPYFWTPADCEFHKNESSWCADNALNEIDWLRTEDAEEIERMLQSEIVNCSCRLLDFRFSRVVDNRPTHVLHDVANF
jgi:hypothetical protein